MINFAQNNFRKTVMKQNNSGTNKIRRTAILTVLSAARAGSRCLSYGAYRIQRLV